MRHLSQTRSQRLRKVYRFGLIMLLGLTWCLNSGLNWGLSSARAQSDELKNALLDLFPNYASAELLSQYAKECNPTQAQQIEDNFQTWRKEQGLSAFPDLLSKNLSAQEQAKLDEVRRTNLANQVRRNFPRCLSAIQFLAVLDGPSFNVRFSKEKSLRTLRLARP